MSNAAVARRQLAQAVAAAAAHYERGLVARGIFDRLDLEPAPFRPARIHAQQHVGPVLAFGAACTGVDLQIGIGAVGFARKQRLDFVAVGAVGQPGERIEPFTLDIGIAFGSGAIIAIVLVRSATNQAATLRGSTV